jgi:hypothetical protein
MKIWRIFLKLAKLLKFTQIQKKKSHFLLENKHRCPRGSHPSHLDEKKEDEIQIEKLMWTRGNGSDFTKSTYKIQFHNFG